MNWFVRLFSRSDWRLVKTINANYNVTDTLTQQVEKTGCTLTYYLYENQFNKRIIDLIDSEKGDLDVNELQPDNWAFRNRIYRETIKPWMDGAFDPRIPSYESIKAKEFKDTLTGRKT